MAGQAHPTVCNNPPDWISATQQFGMGVTWPIGSSNTMKLVVHTCLDISLPFLAKAWLLELDDKLPGYI